LKELITIPNVKRVFYGNAMADIWALSKCKIIIGSDSTFSGGGAYIGQKPIVFRKCHFGRVLNLKQNGKIMFNVPNAHSLIARKKGENWGIALLLEHTLFFTEKTIVYLANQLKMDIVTIRKCGSPYPFGTAKPSLSAFGLNAAQFEIDERLNIQAVLKNVKTKPRLKNLLKIGQYLPKSPLFGKILRSVLGILGIGDHFFVVYRNSMN